MIQETYTITEKHKLVISRGWIGVDIHKITDVGQLVEWWNKLLRLGGPVNKIQDKDLHHLQVAIWTRVNALYPTRALKFDDLESVDKILNVHQHVAA